MIRRLGAITRNVARAPPSARVVVCLVAWLAAAGAGYGAIDPWGMRSASLPPGLHDPADEPAQGKFLIAARSLLDPNFRQSVVLLLEYDANGALGLVVNRRSGVALRSLLPEVEELEERDDPVYLGGPVNRNQLFLLLRGESLPPQAEEVGDGVYASASIEALRAAAGGGGAEFHAYAGYAGWSPGQLDAEVDRGDWLIAPADATMVFASDPDTVWPELIRRHSGRWVRAEDGAWRDAIAAGA